MSGAKAKPKVEHTPWGPRVRVQVDASQGGKTIQSARKEADINHLVARARASGQWPAPKRLGQYGDFSDVPDFHAAQEHVLKTRAAFEQLPAELRDRCANDPGVFIARMNDPEILSLMVKHGLATEREAAPSPAKPHQPLEDPQGEAKPGGAGSAGGGSKKPPGGPSGGPSDA